MLNIRTFSKLTNQMSKNKKSAQTNFQKSVSNQNASAASTGPITMDKSNKILINILAKPGARQNAITDLNQENIGVQINAPPSDGEANAELVKYIAKIFDLRKSDVTLERGHKSRQKLLKLDCKLSIEEITNKLKNEIS